MIGRTDAGFLLDGLGKLNDGWLDTGDLARIDSEGFVYLTGRAKDLIIRGGHNIDPATIEDALLAHPDVSGAAAVGRPDAHAGEVPVAYVTVSAGSPVTGDDLLRWAEERVTERGAVPKAVTIVDSIPVTAVGKPYKVSLRADATRIAIEQALAGVDGVDAIGTHIDDGAIVVTVCARPDIETDSLTDILGRYPITWEIRNSVGHARA